MRNVVGEIESDICTLAGVKSAHIVLGPDELEIEEIHVVASHERPPKQVVRDIESLLLNNHNMRVDHKIISIAQLKDPIAADEEAPRRARSAGMERIRFVSAKSNTYGLRVEVTVELERGGIPSTATANGAGSRQNKARMVAEATAEALNNFLDDDQAVAVEDIIHTDVGTRHKAVVAVLSLLSKRDEKVLVGSSLLQDDLPKAVVQATLDAVNRAIGASSQ
jgi:hypothetical protein